MAVNKQTTVNTVFCISFIVVTLIDYLSIYTKEIPNLTGAADQSD